MLAPQLLRALVIWLTLNFRSFNAQVNPTLCPQGPITSKDPKWPNIPERFEVSIELVSTEESIDLIQTFSTQRDAMSVTVNKGFDRFFLDYLIVLKKILDDTSVSERDKREKKIFLDYWDFETNEQFTVINLPVSGELVPNCIRKTISVNTSTSVLDFTNVIKPSVLLGFDARNKPDPNFGTKYVNHSFVRHIPVNVFEGCFYLPDSQVTVAATYYMSDNAQFQGLDPTNQSFPLRIEIQMKHRPTEGEATYVYNIFRYETNPSKGQERQALETPPGVYCSNRTSTVSFPSAMPERYSFNIELVNAGNSSAITSSHNVYDKVLQFVRLDVWSENMQNYTALLDYAIGLHYHYEPATRHCMVSDIIATDMGATLLNGHPQLVEMDDVLYQYSGSRRCRDHVLCHVWLAESPVANKTDIEHREWYWGYQFNGKELEKWVPVKLVTYRMDSNGKRMSFTETNLYNYRQNSAVFMEIAYTLADCYRAMGPTEKFYYGIFTFIIDNENQYPVQKNIAYLQSSIWETLAARLQVRPIRLGHVVVDHNTTDLIVTFTLLDNPPRHGPVQNPLQEPSLDLLVERLRTLINSNNLMFRARYDESKEVALVAKNASLNVLVRVPPPTVILQNVTVIVDETVTRIIEVIETETTVRKSGSRITGLWIGFIVVGLLLGFVGGFLVFRRIAARR